MLKDDKYIVIGHGKADITIVADPETGQVYAMICDPENFEIGTYTGDKDMIPIKNLPGHIQDEIYNNTID